MAILPLTLAVMLILEFGKKIIDYLVKKVFTLLITSNELPYMNIAAITRFILESGWMYLNRPLQGNSSVKGLCHLS